MSSYQEHVAHVLKHGLARNNRFQVLIPLPLALQRRLGIEQSKPSRLQSVIRTISKYLGGGTEVTRGLEIMTESTEFPSKSLPTTDIRYNGDFYRLPYAALYNMHPIVFRCSQDLYEKNIIDAWMDLIFDPVRYEVSYLDEYATNITINQLDSQDRITHSVTLIEAFPTFCNPLTLSNEEQNNYHRLSTQWTFRRWARDGEREQDISDRITSLTQSPLGPIVTPILSNPLVKRGLSVIKDTTGLDLDGEGAAIYNRIDQIMRNTTGTSINKAASQYESLRAAILSNNKLTNNQRATFVGMIDSLLTALRG